MQLLLVRHGVTDETGSRLTGRLPGVGLSEEGVRQARATADYVKSFKPKTLITSPVQRCRETAEVIGETVQLDPAVDDAFEEMDFGDWSGRTLRSLSKLKAWGAIQMAPSLFRFPNGESFLEMQSRALLGIASIGERKLKGPVVVCSHGDVIKAMLSHHVGAQLDSFQRISVAPASVSSINGRTVTFINRIPWEKTS